MYMYMYDRIQCSCPLQSYTTCSLIPRHSPSPQIYGWKKMRREVWYLRTCDKCHHKWKWVMRPQSTTYRHNTMAIVVLPLLVVRSPHYICTYIHVAVKPTVATCTTHLRVTGVALTSFEGMASQDNNTDSKTSYNKDRIQICNTAS